MKKMILLSLLLIVIPIAGQDSTLAERLGYSPDTRLLIIHADDAGVSHSTNQAVTEAFKAGVINSTAIMVPCPWFPEMAEFAREHPEYDYGLHLTYTSEWYTYKWGSVAPSDQVKSLLDEQGYFYATTEEAVEHAKPDEVEIELRAQIEKALAAGLNPSHFDSHMLPHFGNPEVFRVYLNLGKEYRIPVLLPANYFELSEELLIPELRDHIIIDHIYEASPGVEPAKWNEYYNDILRNLTPGVSELIFHLACNDEETRAMTRGHDYYEAEWRQRDLDYALSEEFRDLLEENNIRLITWKDIKNLLYPE
jgi:predicted glycoside hydrolase/deacetylase ChbG (UPF0249 family)